MGSLIFIIIIVVVIISSKNKVANVARRPNNGPQVDPQQVAMEKQRQEQLRREQQRRDNEAKREADMKRREDEDRREADRVRNEQRRQEAQLREEVVKGMSQQGSYRSAARKQELLQKYKNKRPDLTQQELEEDIRQGRILSRSSDYVDEDFDIDKLESEGDLMEQINDLMVMGPSFTLSKERDFLAEADQLLWRYKE